MRGYISAARLSIVELLILSFAWGDQLKIKHSKLKTHPFLMPLNHRLEQLQRVVVTANQMSQIEARLFAAGMPVAALMEKVAVLVAGRIQALYPAVEHKTVGVLVGPGHNGGDALVVARELHLNGYGVRLYCPFEHLKELTACHARYAASLAIATEQQVATLQSCDLLVDGLFGVGLTRSLSPDLAAVVDQINGWGLPVLSIDLPSGLHTDTGAALGTAICATHTFCLGLWKRAFLQDQALAYTGEAELIDFGLPLLDVQAVVPPLEVQRITPQMAIAALPLPRPVATHKYREGHLLLVCGSRQYMGAALLSALAARASGVGMLSVAVPESLRSLLIAQVPDALVLGCPETPEGAIARLPEGVDLGAYQAIACGPGLTAAAIAVVQQVLAAPCPLVLDADGLNNLASLGRVSSLHQRPATTILTPHPGEFRRLFPTLNGQPVAEQMADRIEVVQAAAQLSGAIVLLKGARVAIAVPKRNPPGIPTVFLNPHSTPALARGGSGDVLTGLLGGLLAQVASRQTPPELVAVTATWWHAHAAMFAAQTCSELGVDASSLVKSLIPALGGL